MVVWMIRQNPYKKTDENSMLMYLLKHNIVTCPFGHTSDYSDSVAEGHYDSFPIGGWTSNGQTKVFIEKMKVDDLLVIPLGGSIKKMILAKVSSVSMPPIIFSGLYVVRKDDSILKITSYPDQYRKSGAEIDPWDFKPIYRKIEVIKVIDLPPRSEFSLPICSLAKLNNNKHLFLRTCFDTPVLDLYEEIIDDSSEEIFDDDSSEM